MFKGFRQFILLLVIATSGCIKDTLYIDGIPKPPPPPPPLPIADFLYNPAATPYQTKISFINNSQGATSYKWDFGDNSTSTDSFPVHTYAVGGTYNVKLIAYGPGGIHTRERAISVANPPNKCIWEWVTLNSYLSGTNYDAGSYADVYVIIKTSTVTYTSRANYYFNSNPALSRTFSFSPLLTFMPLSEPVILTFWDADEAEKGDADDLMGTFIIKPTDYTSGSNAFPANINLNGGSINCTIGMSWQ